MKCAGYISPERPFIKQFEERFAARVEHNNILESR